MNIILLSGGSGKRLWPLSNDIRSKQFIKTFYNEENELESMVQRIYRQIMTADQYADITIATSKKQVSAIKNQLGSDVSVCVEPDRRDTFPAICLAAMFLYEKKQIDVDEIIVTCPIDPYVDDSYFLAIKELSDLAKTGEGNLFLMGIEPTYPSEKYGYIVPESTNHLSPVKTFKEKPDVQNAEIYIKQGALWNSGVFAFKLGYMIECAHKLIEFTDYNDLLNKYPTLDKISFDYAVVEKEQNIQVLRYAGEWKDIGTWNTFSETMVEPTIGNVTLDPECTNTNVINELNIPILCMGCTDLIIAASGDGILVSDKSQSSYIKPYVDNIEQQVMYAEKSWGSFTVLDVQNDNMTIKIKLLAGHKLHYHSHEFRDEVWTIVSGDGVVVVDGIERTVMIGDVIQIKAGCKHTIIAKSELGIVEVQLGKNITVEDKVKYEL